VDDPASFARILDGLRRVAGRVPVLFPMHPRTRKQVAAHGLESAFVFHECIGKLQEGGDSGIHVFPPLGYLEFLNLMASAAVVLTDSGGFSRRQPFLESPASRSVTPRSVH
jgi:UDP-N-acetylglucosamine 2-epimerase (non-hydrolysing)